jgi:hypothetical protein
MLERIRKTVESIGFVGLFASFLTIAVSFDYVYKEYLSKGGNNDPLIWAFTVALGFVAFIGLLNYCVYAQSVVADEIVRVSAAKAKLEEQVLRRRLSSKANSRRRS